MCGTLLPSGICEWGVAEQVADKIRESLKMEMDFIEAAQEELNSINYDSSDKSVEKAKAYAMLALAQELRNFVEILAEETKIGGAFNYHMKR
jgi:hypothetical protein